MKARSVLYAAVGAPVVAARKVSEKAGNITTKLSEHAGGYGESFGKAVDNWAAEGEKIIGRVGEGKVVDELTSKVDLDQAKEQVNKLRDQLEDMLSTWRSSFRPEKAETQKAAPATETDTPAEKTAKTTAKKPVAKTSASKPKTGKTDSKASAAKTTKSTAAKTSQAKAKTTSAVDKAS